MDNSEFTLLVLPEEVMYRYIFPHLSQKDLLRLRRVCFKTNVYADGYIRIHFNNYEKEINETDHTIAEFIRRNLPSSKIYLNNTGPEFFADPLIAKFLQLYGEQITHLRVRHFSTCITEPENAFFLALTNLKHLEIHYIDASARGCTSSYRVVNGEKIPCHIPYFPANFANLKTLKLHNIQTSDPSEFCYYWEFVKFCSNLEHLKHPKFLNVLDGMSCGGHGEGHGGPFSCVTECIEKRKAENPVQPIILKTFDLEHHEEQGFHSFDYIFLNEKCFENNVKLMNVDANLFEVLSDALREDFHTFSEPLASVRNLHGSMLMGELPNLEKLVITSTKACSYGNFWRNDQPEWPKLNEIDINIDSKRTQGKSNEFLPLPLEELFDFLFVDVERSNMKNLCIRFDCNQTYGNSRQLPIPRALDVVASCSNLTSLTLQNWIGTNKAVSRFWSSLTLLEEVTLEACKMLGDVAFVGKHREDPSFLKLTKLRKFSLIKLDQMPKITDLIFNLVFKNLSIKEFYLTSDEPIKSITQAGIQALATGPFNASVEKFPFKDWSLENVFQQEFDNLEKEFRAYFLL